MRTFAILNMNENMDISNNILKHLPSDDKKYVFCPSDHKDFDCDTNTEVIILPEDILTHNTKLKNYVTKYFFDNGFKGFLHEIEDSVQIMKNPSVFLEKIEEMMSKLNQKSWLNTTCDGCNFIYAKYNPRLILNVDEEDVKDVYNGQLAWCSNANTAWMCYNYDIADYDDVKFDETFDFPMFYIIKFLAMRRNMKKNGELYYMNLYPSIPAEMKTFRTIESPQKSKYYVDFTQEMVQKEDQKFREMNIDTHPDSDFGKLIEDIHSILLSKKI